MYKRILVPLDGSELAEKALPHVKDLCAENTEILLLEVIRLPLPIMTPDISISLPVVDTEELKNEARKYLKGIAEQLEKEGLRVSYDVVEADDVVDAIVKYAIEHQVNLIVKSTHGRGGLSRLVFGSTAEGVLRKAPCPVMFIRA